MVETAQWRVALLVPLLLFVGLLSGLRCLSRELCNGPTQCVWGGGGRGCTAAGLGYCCCRFRCQPWPDNRVVWGASAYASFLLSGQLCLSLLSLLQGIDLEAPFQSLCIGAA